MNNILTYSLDSDGIAVITLRMADAPTNLFTMECIRTYIEVASMAVKDPNVKGIVLTSGHNDFMAGADLNAVLNPPYSPEELSKPQVSPLWLPLTAQHWAEDMSWH
jgi:3-hydroxyacyl-CoA dehydrogenase/enoyl-CoA hydratase/3-hydroxybutyryl-CoA epimerase